MYVISSLGFFSLFMMEISSILCSGSFVGRNMLQYILSRENNNSLPAVVGASSYKEVEPPSGPY